MNAGNADGFYHRALQGAAPQRGKTLGRANTSEGEKPGRIYRLRPQGRGGTDPAWPPRGRHADRQSRRYLIPGAGDARRRRRDHRRGHPGHQDIARALWNSDAARRLSRAQRRGHAAAPPCPAFWGSGAGFGSDAGTPLISDLGSSLSRMRSRKISRWFQFRAPRPYSPLWWSRGCQPTGSFLRIFAAKKRREARPHR